MNLTSVQLSPRYESFVRALLTEPSQAAALRKCHKPAAKWSAQKVAETASRWAARPEIRARLAQLQQDIAREVVLERAEVIRAIHALATSDIRGVVNDRGQIRLPHELDGATAAAVSKFKMSFDGSIEYTFHSKTTALDQACKILGLYEQDNKQKTDPLAELLRSLGGRVLGVTSDNRATELDDAAFF
ncbi:MAG: terminase small subunit [Betaproteobacteria bacterium]|nr:terminase small subunit [Betaproteobacteria bacterium]